MVLLHSIVDTCEINAREVAEFVEHNSAPGPSLDILIGQKHSFNYSRPSQAYQHPQFSHDLALQTIFVRQKQSQSL